MRKLTSKETKYVNELLDANRSADERLIIEDVSATKAASIYGYQDGINYALKTFFDIYLGGEK